MQLIFSILWIFKIACPLEIFKHDWWKGTGRCNPMYAKHYFFKFQNKKKKKQRPDPDPSVSTLVWFFYFFW